jgi:hypothetical protein
MKWETLSTITLLIVAFLYICAEAGAQNYIQQYSGAYNIYYTTRTGSDEAYALKSNGTATWVYGWKDRYGKIQTKTKDGKWTAAKGSITVSINGNTGIITETYKLINGKFVSTEDRARYLKKR